jgi:hypothetical protein
VETTGRFSKRSSYFFYFTQWKLTDTRPRDRCSRAQLVYSSWQYSSSRPVGTFLGIEIKGAISRNQFREGRNVVGAAEMAVAVPLSVTRAERVLGVGDWFDPAAAWQAAVEVWSVKVSKILVKL